MLQLPSLIPGAISAGATRPRLRDKGTVERRTDHPAPRGLTRLFHRIVVGCIDHTALCGLTCLQVRAPPAGVCRGYAPHHRSRGLSGLTRLNMAARHNTRMGLWGGVRHPRFFWPVWRHILGGPMRVPSHANRGAGFAHTTVGVGGPGKATFWDAPSTPVALGGGWAACNLS